MAHDRSLDSLSAAALSAAPLASGRGDSDRTARLFFRPPPPRQIVRAAIFGLPSALFRHSLSPFRSNPALSACRLFRRLFLAAASGLGPRSFQDTVLCRRRNLRCYTPRCFRPGDFSRRLGSRQRGAQLRRKRRGRYTYTWQYVSAVSGQRENTWQKSQSSVVVRPVPCAEQSSPAPAIPSRFLMNIWLGKNPVAAG